LHPNRMTVLRPFLTESLVLPPVGVNRNSPQRLDGRPEIEQFRPGRRQCIIKEVLCLLESSSEPFYAQTELHAERQTHHLLL